jgi:hypothetical protein
VRFHVVALALLLMPLAGSARQPDTGDAPLPEVEPFFAAVRENLARAQRDQDRFAYKERRTEFHMNPFGRLGTGGTRVYEVVPGPDDTTFTRRLIERDGMPVAGEIERRQRSRNRADRPSGRRGVDDVVATLDFRMDRREDRDGRSMIAITFAPKPDARPRTREGRMARVFAGTIWVDEQAREVESVEATAIDDMTVGFGVVARLNEGTKASLTRRAVADGLWLPTSIRLTGQGRAMLFRKLNVDYAIEWFDYRTVAGR